MLACMAVFAIAGVWQIQRGQAKALMLTQREAAIKAPAQPLHAVLGTVDMTQASPLDRHHVVARGRYDGARQILLDNQIQNGHVGYRVWTPLVLRDGRRLLIDRGWVPLGPGGRAQPPEPTAPGGELAVQGLLRTLPQPGVRLGDAPACASAHWPRILNYPTIDTIRCLYQAPVIDGLVLLDEGEPHGFVRQWHAQTSMPPKRHYAYALQWFALALAVVVVFLVVNMKRTR